MATAGRVHWIGSWRGVGKIESPREWGPHFPRGSRRLVGVLGVRQGLWTAIARSSGTCGLTFQKPWLIPVCGNRSSRSMHDARFLVLSTLRLKRLITKSVVLREFFEDVNSTLLDLIQ